MKRGNAYRVPIAETDPDLAPGALLDAVKAATIYVQRGQIRQDHPIRCSQSECPGRNRERQPWIARVSKTPPGFLFRAVLPLSHELWPTLEDPVVMIHPDLPGPPAEVTRQALERVWVHKGWQEAPAGTKVPKKYLGQYGVLIRDLLDFDSDQHPPLRVSCRYCGEQSLDRLRLLERVRSASSPRSTILTSWVTQC